MIKHGIFKINKAGEEIGIKYFKQKIRGYISFVQGENPYSFPYKIYPKTFDAKNSYEDSIDKPTLQLNEKRIIQPIEFTDCYMTSVGSYQKDGYENAIRLLKGTFIDRENMEMGIGWQKIDIPLQTLNMVYPSVAFDAFNAPEYKGTSKFDPRTLIGRRGLDRIMTYNKETKREYEYKSKIKKKFGEVFSQDEIGKYSGKIATITKKILDSSGIILVYSQYIDGGSVPIALALEQIGITRYGRTANLFKKGAIDVDQIDYTMKAKKDVRRFLSSSLCYDNR